MNLSDVNGIQNIKAKRDTGRRIDVTRLAVRRATNTVASCPSPSPATSRDNLNVLLEFQTVTQPLKLIPGFIPLLKLYIAPLIFKSKLWKQIQTALNRQRYTVLIFLRNSF